MLVLSRGLHDEIKIGDDIIVTVLRVSGGNVKIGVTAPRSVRVMRGEFIPDDPAESEGVVAAPVELADIMSCVGLSPLSPEGACGEGALSDSVSPDGVLRSPSLKS